jgi:molybdate transport system substrate-binding protein
MHLSRLGRLVALGIGLAVLFNACSAAAPAAPSPAPTAATNPTASTSASSAPAPTATPGSTTELTVFAAASLTGSFDEIAKGFQAANPGTKVTYSFGGSNDLAAQITKGAPADVFASANTAQMAVVVKAGQVDASAAKNFAQNRLVVIYPKDNPAKLAKLQDLANPNLKLVLAAKEVPVGQYALDFLGKASKDPAFGADYQAAVQKNVVSNEQDVKAVLNKVVLGEADAGIVYATDVTPDAAVKVGRLDIPDALNTIATYPIAPLKASPHADLAAKFVAYVLGDGGQTVLAKYGFLPPPKSTAGLVEPFPFARLDRYNFATSHGSVD